MKTVPKLIRRFVETLILSTVVLVAVNIFLLLFMLSRIESNAHPYSAAEDVAAALTRQGDTYVLTEKGVQILEENDAWAILIADGSGQVIWSQGPLPEKMPQTFSLAQVASLTRGYLEDYPTYPAAAEGGLLVLGFPSGSYWKHQWPSWNTELIASVPGNLASWAICNVLVIFLIYLAANGRIVKSVGPLVSGAGQGGAGACAGAGAALRNCRQRQPDFGYSSFKKPGNPPQGHGQGQLDCRCVS